MAYELGYIIRFERQKSKKPTSTSINFEPQVPVPKRVITKVQGNKASVDGVLRKKEKISSATCSLNSYLALLCSKVIDLLPEDILQKYQDKFLYKPVDPEYYVDAISDIELRTNFLKPFADNHLMKFIGMKSKYNLDYVKAFYCNLELTTKGL